MSSGCGDVLSLEDLKTAKKHQLFEAEVITGRAGGVITGDQIDYAANQVTGQVQKTMPAILRDIGFIPAPFDFTSGGTLTVNMRDYAVLWPLPGGDGDWYYWEGALPKVIPASSTPASTGGVSNGAWRPVGDITLRGELASTDAGKGASLVQTEENGSVQDFVTAEILRRSNRTEYVTPEMYGAVGNGVTDDTAAWQAAVNTGLEVRGRTTSTYLLASSVIFSWPAVKQLIDGRGCTIRVTGNYTPFNQRLGDNSVSRITQNKSYINLVGVGPTSAAGVYNDFSSSDFINFSYGYAANITATGFTNAVRGQGYTHCTNIRGDDLRNALWSCYEPGFNSISDSSCGWCSGDGLIFKGSYNSADSITFDVAGAIPADSQEAVPSAMARGVVVSAGADGEPASFSSISNITCRLFGAGGLYINGNSVNVGGACNLGSIYEDTYVAAKSAAALSLIVNDCIIGDVKFGNVFSGVGINANSNNTRIGTIDIKSKKAVSGAFLLSVGDSPTAAITNLDIEAIVFHGQSTINDDVYINTAGVRIGRIHVSALNNQQGGNTVNIAKAATIDELNLIATNSSSTNNIVMIQSNAKISKIYIERVFGTAITVSSGSFPVLGDVHLNNKQGTAAPIRINGDGAGSFYWGNVYITGPSITQPLVDGNIVMQGYTGPGWRRLSSGIASTASYPVKVSNALSA